MMAWKPRDQIDKAQSGNMLAVIGVKNDVVPICFDPVYFGDRLTTNHGNIKISGICIRIDLIFGMRQACYTIGDEVNKGMCRAFEQKEIGEEQTPDPAGLWGVGAQKENSECNGYGCDRHQQQQHDCGFK